MMSRAVLLFLAVARLPCESLEQAVVIDGTQPSVTQSL